MKRVKIILMLLLLILTLKVPVIKAEGGKIEVTTDKDKVTIGEEFTISISTKNLEVAACTIRLYFDQEKVELVSKPEENSNSINGTILYTYFDKQGGKNIDLNTNLAKFTFKAKEDGVSIFMVQGEFYEAKEKQIKPAIYPVEVTIGEQTISDKEDTPVLQENEENNSTNLAILRLDQEGISPNFQKDIKEYYITIPEQVKSLEVVAVPENKNSKVTIIGNTNLKSGLNEIIITVTMQDTKKESKYKIYVTKTNNIEGANSNLENLAIENEILEPNFTEEVMDYNVSIGNNVEKLNILAIPQNEKAKVKIEGTEQLKEGTNNITITVTAPNGISFKKYEITAYKKSKTEEIQESSNQEEVRIEEVENIDNSKEIKQVEEKNRKEETKNGLVIIIGTIIGISILGSILIILIKQRKKKTKSQ